MQAPPTLGQYPEPKKQTNVVLWVVLAVFGVGCCGLIGIFAAIGLPIVLQARSTAQTTRCMSNTKELALAMTMYSMDNNDLMPPADKWMDDVQSYAKVSGDPTFCPAARAQNKEATGYAFNQELGGKNMVKLGKDGSNLPLVFDSTLPGRNATSGLETLPNPGRHRRRGEQGNNVAYVDASARFVPLNP